MKRYIYIIGVMLMLTTTMVRAQIVIGGKVFGGARQANVGGSTSVDIGADIHNVLINSVYGGNDISGTIGQPLDALNAHVTVNAEKESGDHDQPYYIFIGNLFGGGNGDYDYTSDDSPYKGMSIPELGKAKIEIYGGTIAYVYGGGNAATVTGTTDITIDNHSKVTTTIKDTLDKSVELLTAGRMEAMGIPQIAGVVSRPVYHFSRVFGGNNKAEMKIHPTWHLLSGNIENLYSGGNEGDMTFKEGLILEIPTGSNIMVDNVYGGCRKANVHPIGDNGAEVRESDIQLSDTRYKFPAGLSARVRIAGGDINNVYGGNDITGNVTGGNGIGVYTSIRGNIYGGGNGSYPYTDNAKLKGTLAYGDYYYGDKITADKNSVETLNDFRPNAEQVSIYVAGTEANKTVIGGSIYVGGNSATLSTTKSTPLVELKIGSYVYADKVFLGNNGEYMVDNGVGGVLTKYASDVEGSEKKFNSMPLTNVDTFAVYMRGCAMTLMPRVVFDGDQAIDVGHYEDYTSYFGSFYCGGNVGSMIREGLETINFTHKVIIFDKLVGGCNNAYVKAKTGINAEYIGGIIGTDAERAEGGYEEDGKIKDRLHLNLSGLLIEPKRWKDPDDKSQLLEWNIFDRETDTAINEADIPALTNDEGKDYQTSNAADLKRRFKSGNIYGGCCESGVVNGNVVINLNATIMNRNSLFDEIETSGEESLYGDDLLTQPTYKIKTRRTGVLLGQQGMDVHGVALNLFGGGKGSGTQIWGSTTININKGYVFQIFGGSEEGVIGRPANDGTYSGNDEYSCYVNLKGIQAGSSKSEGNFEKMPECEFIYGGGYRGLVAGNTVVRLGNGRIFNSFAGSCDADILGHTETYVGYHHTYVGDNGAEVEVDGFPWIRDIVYGGNDLGGEIQGTKDFSGTTASAYVKYSQGHADAIFGGHYGTYDYSTDEYERNATTHKMLHMGNAFVNFNPSNTESLRNNANNVVDIVYGGSQGQPGDFDSNKTQESSYVLINIPDEMENFKNMNVFGSGAWGGLGMKTKVENKTAAEIAALTSEAKTAYEKLLDDVSAIVNLAKGQIGSAYGGSYKEGFTRRTVVNVPSGSTIKLGSIFGGAYGESNSAICDVYEANVEYHSKDARVSYLYGGNNNARRTLYGRVNIDVPVWTDPSKTWLATVYGAGYGLDTWSEYTEVNLKANDDTTIGGAKVYQVFGGGYNGRVMNQATVNKWANEDDKKYPLAMGDYTNGLANPLVKLTELGDTCNTNVRVYRYATIGHDAITKGGYGYGGGQGTKDISKSGDVNGTTYIALLGGTAYRDVYAAGSVGTVLDEYGNQLAEADRFVATTNAYIAGGSVRNVYGGGYMGSVGKHRVEGLEEGDISGSTANDILGKSNVVIGIRKDQTTLPADYGFYNGVPTIQRNAYGGGEGETKKGGRGGAVFGTTNVTINNGAIGYYYDPAITTRVDSLPVGYERKIDDETYFDEVTGEWAGTDRLKDYGCVFGGGYSDKSNVDFTNVTIWGGVIRGSLYGGAEVAAVGRGSTKEAGAIRTLNAIYKAGGTKVTMYNGHVMRNVFGGGKGYNILGYGGANDLYTDGYVFGQTEVYIHGGEVGTAEGAKSENSYGNVFGAGDVGYVYSKGYFNEGVNTENLSHTTTTGSPGHYYYYYNDELTEDCKVVVSPYLQVAAGKSVPYNDKVYGEYEYVPTEYLNTLSKKTTRVTETGTVKDWPEEWDDLITEETVNGGTVDRGVIIHNAVFAGGNVSTNNDKTYANATTVFGNVTATLYDVYHRDFISVGTEHIGGLYGGGNFSMVDGYRELNITNYGTDYFSLDQQINLDTYRGLSNRERAYFKLKYECKDTITFTKEGETNSRQYVKDEKIDEDVYLRLLDRYGSQVEEAFTPWGICSIYAGRLLNTVQRADFCGVFGSRMVLQGAKDRVAETNQDTDYTINRVGEVSLNKEHTVRTSENGFSDPDTGDDVEHGNYFGIYSVVNYMGNLTSDVHFDDPYAGPVAEGQGKTFYKYKAGKSTSANRNKAECLHQVALASGVHLELTTENSTENHKDYGYITGIVELDLINVKKDKVMGGGFVYAKNEHRVPKYFPAKGNVLLSGYNKMEGDEAITFKRFRYSASDTGEWPTSNDDRIISGDDDAYATRSWQTSGNFIHKDKTIIDDCYPTNNAYTIGSANYSEAHYWYVKGEVYVYDQIVTAYTGSASAYHKESQLNLTITAASNGRLQLLNVKPNLYAYKMPKSDKDLTGVKIGSLNDADGNPIDHVTVNNEHDSYKLNDVITWWDWHQLNEDERKYFVTETWVNSTAVKVTETIGGKQVDSVYVAGTFVMDATDRATIKGKFENNTISIKDAKGQTIKDADDNDASFDYIFRPSNNISHDQGYALTFDMSTPPVWGKYYTSTTHGNNQTNQAGGDGYLSAPTYYPINPGVYGKQKYNFGDIITKNTYDAYKTYASDADINEHLEPLLVATAPVTYTYSYVDENNQTVTKTETANKGTAVPKSKITSWESGSESNLESAKKCINTVKLADAVYLGYGELKTAAEIEALKTQYAYTKDENNETVTNQKLIDAIDAAMVEAYFCNKPGTFGGQQFNSTQNYDVIDAWCALSKEDRNAGGFKFNQDAFDLLAAPSYLNLNGASPEKFPTEEATKSAYGNTYGEQVRIEYDAICKEAIGNYHEGDTIRSTEFEALPNDQCHYTRVELEGNATKAYIVLQNFTLNGVPYGKGQIVDIDLYSDVNDNTKIKEHDFGAPGIYYYRYENYSGDTHDQVINEDTYDDLPNQQKYFIIQGKEPVETSTLYVSSESDVLDLSKERVYSVIYQYTYYENEDNNNVKFTNELHVVNVHVQMESGVPIIGPLAVPDIVIPGNSLTMSPPDVTIGTYPPIGNGWEIFDNEQDAKLGRNGVAYESGKDPLYWYQNGDYYINFYSKNYLGKMYAKKPMPLRVANYHDLDAVMADTEHHLYIDRPDVERECKIYIDNRECQSDAEKNELDLLKDFFDLSLTDALGSHVHGARNLEFILQSDMSPKKYTTWNPIGTKKVGDTPGQCFEGALHGDGHTISGLTSSLFNNLCGEVYNLGVTGTFTGSGIVEEGTGYLENCWVRKTGTGNVTEGTKALFGTTTDTETRNVHLMNCYYPKENGFAAQSGATEKPLLSFYNGEVAYSLNSYYLFKRYCDQQNLQTTDVYKFWERDDSGLKSEPSSGKYESKSGPYLLNDKSGNYVGSYVELRYADGDFIYAGGEIPSAANERLYIDKNVENDKGRYYPIWPDDYLFFGQTLNYGVDGATHQDEPTAVTSSNRVYRAPAYFGDADMGTAYYNQDAVFAKAGYEKGMTAIDFSGGNGDVSGGYKYGAQEDGKFYPPLLDDGGLTGFNNVDMTRNLLVYTPAASTTTSLIQSKLSDKAYTEIDSKYRSVAEVPVTDVRKIQGHWIQQSGNRYVAARDHLLVDKEDFFCPIEYSFDEDHCMWYQRKPDLYVDRSKGWEGVSLPFTADIVTTHQKGELTHFYGDSSTGHEYWLREYKGEGDGSTASVIVANFNRPAATGRATDNKTVENTFLWDYYYNEKNDANKHLDSNTDEYQTYYNSSRTYPQYPRLQNGVPYIIGFPGETYYEFDLSGAWTTNTTASPQPEALEQQTITFASAQGATIATCDGVTGVEFSGYTFQPNYQSKQIESGGAYMLNAAGSSFDVTTAVTTTVPFRPYFTYTAPAANPSRPMARSIVFSGDDSQLKGVDDRDKNGDEAGGLNIYSGRKKIVVESTLREATEVRIVNVAGVTITTFSIEPGESIKTQIVNAGVYIVQTTDGRYNRKVAVR